MHTPSTPPKPWYTHLSGIEVHDPSTRTPEQLAQGARNLKLARRVVASTALWIALSMSMLHGPRAIYDTRLWLSERIHALRVLLHEHMPASTPERTRPEHEFDPERTA